MLYVVDLSGNSGYPVILNDPNAPSSLALLAQIAENTAP